jgi:hypothetical protein
VGARWCRYKARVGESRGQRLEALDRGHQILGAVGDPEQVGRVEGRRVDEAQAGKAEVLHRPHHGAEVAHVAGAVEHDDKLIEHGYFKM